MIYWMCPKSGAPSGGVWFIHRLAHLLNSSGHPSRVLQTVPFDVWWDNNPVPADVIQRGPVDLWENDVLIVPEVLWPNSVPPEYLHSPARKIVFVQNTVWMSREMNLSNVDVLVCSRHLYNRVDRIWGARPIGIVRPYLDKGVWGSAHKIKGLVTMMGRRTTFGASMRDRLLHAGFSVDYIEEPISQDEWAKHLADAEYYVHIQYPEGFPMAAAEAMRSRTLVVGTTGGGGNEFMFHRETAMVVPDPDVSHSTREDFMDGIVENMKWLRDNPNWREKISDAAFTFSLRYSAEATLGELKAVLDL